MATIVHEHPGSPLIHHDPSAAAQAYRELERSHRQEEAELRRKRAWLYAGGRVLLGALFLVSAFAKARNFGPTTAAMSDLDITDPAMLLSVAIFLELVGGLALALGLRTRVVATALIGYLAMVTLLVNNDLSIEFNQYMALCNVGFIGALLMLVGHGSGAISVDKLLARHARRHA